MSKLGIALAFSGCALFGDDAKPCHQETLGHSYRVTPLKRVDSDCEMVDLIGRSFEFRIDGFGGNFQHHPYEKRPCDCGMGPILRSPEGYSWQAEGASMGTFYCAQLVPDSGSSLSSLEVFASGPTGPLDAGSAEAPEMSYYSKEYGCTATFSVQIEQLD